MPALLARAHDALDWTVATAAPPSPLTASAWNTYFALHEGLAAPLLPVK